MAGRALLASRVPGWELKGGQEWGRSGRKPEPLGTQGAACLEGSPPRAASHMDCPSRADRSAGQAGQGLAGPSEEFRLLPWGPKSHYKRFF